MTRLPRKKMVRQTIHRKDYARKVLSRLSFHLTAKEFFELYDVMLEELAEILVEKGYWRHQKLGTIYLDFAKRGFSPRIKSSSLKRRVFEAMHDPKKRAALDEFYDGAVTRYLEKFHPKLLDKNNSC